MNMLTQVRNQYQSMTAKAISHRPDLADRQHVYRQGAGQIVQAMDTFADYATVYSAYTWVQKAVAKIAENIAGLPVRVVDKEDKAIDSHPLTELFAHVNDEQTPIDLWSSYVVNMLLGGENPYEIVPDARNRPVEIWARRPDRVAVVPDASRLAYPTAIGYIYEPEEAAANTITIEAQWMAHDKFYNPLNPWRGLAPIHAVREGLTIDILAQAWSKGFLKSNARPDYAIMAPGGITQSERDRYEEQLMYKFSGRDNWHRPIILEEGVTDIKTFSFPPKDIEWLAQREYSRDEVGAIFGVPDEIMGYGRDTYENFETALTVFWTLTLLPFTRRRDTTLTHHFSRYNLGLLPGQRIATDLSGVGALQEDMTPKVDLAKKYWDMGVPFNTLDKTLKLGIGPVEGGDVGYLASGLKTVEQVQNPPEPPPMPMLPPAREGDEPEQDESEDEPRQRLYLPDGAKDAAKRALKKLVQTYQDAYLRALRSGKHWSFVPELGELQRWIGSDAANAARAIEREIIAKLPGHDDANDAFNALKSDAELTRLLEVAAPAFFTQAGNGLITHKAMLLRLDPDDEEAERDARMGIETSAQEDIAKALGTQQETLLSSIRQYESAPDWMREELESTLTEIREEHELYDMLQRALLQSTSLGVEVAVKQFENVGFAFDYTLAHEGANEWANGYTFDLVRGINGTTERLLRQSLTAWVNNGLPLQDLIDQLVPVFGEQRASAIASTEVTRAYARGTIEGYAAAGYGEGEPTEPIPQHPRCRCWYSLQINNDGSAHFIFLTARDERTCPRCGPLHGKKIGVARSAPTN